MSKNLKYMRFFARECPDFLIGQQSAAQLPWFHIVTLITKLFRRFYQSSGKTGQTASDRSDLSDPLPEIGPTLSVESLTGPAPSLRQAIPELASHFTLGWSQHLSPLTLGDRPE